MEVSILETRRDRMMRHQTTGRPRRGRGARQVALGALLLAALPGAALAQASQGADQVVQGAKKIGKGVEETAKGVGKTVTDGAKEVGERAKAAGQETKPAGDRLHDSAKAFGEALWDGMKSAGRARERFFTGK
jgi:hypothetical protein